jgi:7-cyano-7-deazaguanine synthase in queuosine biosynthesis
MEANKTAAKFKIPVNRTLVMLSGGIDSTAALLHVINNPKRYGQIHVHHINIQNAEYRWVAEAKAVKNVLDYIRVNYTTPFTQSESTINTPHYGNQFLFDTEVISFITGYMTSRDSQIKKVVLGATGTDFASSGSSNATKRSKAMHNAFYFDGEDHNKMVKEFPLSHLTKEEVYLSLPSDLANLTWSCRTPVYKNGTIKECGVCKTCKTEMKDLKTSKAYREREFRV